MSRRPQHRTVLGSLLALCLVAAPAALAGTAAENPVIEAWVEAWNTGAADLDGFLTEGVSFKDPFFDFDGRNHYRDIVNIAHRNWSDIEFTADELLLDGNRGALSFTISATNKASGRAVELKGVSMLSFEDGKIAAEWRVYDAADLARQMGGSVTFPGDGGGGGGDGDDSSAARE